MIVQYEIKMADCKSKLMFCGHCSEHVSRRTYYDHSRQFFEQRSKKWSQVKVFDETLDTSTSVFRLDCRSRSCSPSDPTYYIEPELESSMGKLKEHIKLAY